MEKGIEQKTYNKCWIIKLDFTYPENLAFICTFCGLCCGDTENKTRQILLLSKEANNISEKTGISIESFTHSVSKKPPYVYEMRKTKQGQCLFLENNKCAIYTLRPLICRFYPFELNFSEDQDMHVFRFTLECPAIGKGRPLKRDFFEDLYALARERLC